MLDKPNKWRAALLGGLAIGLVSGLPVISIVNCCCCAGILGGGVFTYYLYRQEHTDAMIPLEASDGLILGIMAGVIGAFAQAALHGLMILVFAGAQERFMQNLMEKLIDRLAQSSGVPGDALDQMRDQIEKSMQESNTMWGVMLNLFMSLIVYPIFAMLGGLLGYGIFRPKKPDQTQSAPTLPQ